MQKDNFKIKKFPGLEKFKTESHTKGQLKVCIATEEIFGPVRNGGIASTYYHLACILSEEGHQVTVLYLKGQHCENETIEHWIEFYGKLGVSFIPLPPSEFELICPSERWQRRMYDLYYYLKNREPFDVVHASEWCGAAYYCLLAKRQKIAFEKTLFLIKSSSPWIWNRHYGMQMVDETAKLTRMFAERKSIELADIVIGGSAHLLTFMEQKGYNLPLGRTFVQPNIVDLEDIEFDESRLNYQYGDIIESDDMVFFGRLEGRKGVEVFCDAIDRLILQGKKYPRHITFLGKEGSRLPTRPELTPIEFIKERSSKWPIEVDIIDSYDRDKAIGYLCARPRIAVMPSLIENSTMAVYECLVQKIPFIASDSGGTPELVHEDYRDRVLCEAHPEPLSAKLHEALVGGAVIAKGAFDYETNLATWKAFHQYLAFELQNHTSDELIEQIRAANCPESVSHDRATGLELNSDRKREKISLCIYHYKRPQYLDSLLNSLLHQNCEIDEIIVVNDDYTLKQVSKVLETYKNKLGNSRFKVVQTPHLCLGAAYNAAASLASGELLIFMNAELHYARNNLVESFQTVAANSTSSVFSCAFDYFDKDNPSNPEENGKTRFLPLGGDLATVYYMNGAGGSCFMVRKPMFDNIGGLFEAYHIAGVENEFYTRAMLSGYQLEFVPESLYWERKATNKIHYNWSSFNYFSILPFLQVSPNYMENILLVARDLYHQVEVLQSHRKKLQADKKHIQAKNQKLKDDNQKLKDDNKTLKDENALLQRQLKTFQKGADRK